MERLKNWDEAADEQEQLSQLNAILGYLKMVKNIIRSDSTKPYHWAVNTPLIDFIVSTL